MAEISRRRFFESAGALAALPVLGLAGSVANAQPSQADGTPETDGVTVDKDIVFAKGGDTDLLLDVYHPAPDKAKRMAIVHLHGGGFRGGSKAIVALSCRAYASQGYVSVASNYRLTGQALWPAQIEDTKAAIRWTRANAERLGVDAEKIAVAGYSAGGLLALVAAGTPDAPEFEGHGGHAGVSSRVAACASYYAATRPGLGLMPKNASAAARAAATPATHVGPGFAPTIFFHGLADTTIPYTSTVEFFDKVHAAGIKAGLHLLQGAPHAFVISHSDTALACAETGSFFFDRLVVNPRTYPPFRFRGAPGRG